MGGFTRGKQWMQWENDLILSGMGPADIAKLTGRKAGQVTSQRTRLKRKTGINSARPVARGACIIDHSHPGPEGWTTGAGPPCLMCGYHTKKFLDGSGQPVFRPECRFCCARQTWADANDGIPQRHDYFDFIPDQYQTSEIEI